MIRVKPIPKAVFSGYIRYRDDGYDDVGYVTPFGVIAAVYLREYAKQGFTTRLSELQLTTCGRSFCCLWVFGLGFFVYIWAVILTSYFSLNPRLRRFRTPVLWLQLRWPC